MFNMLFITLVNVQSHLAEVWGWFKCNW